MACVFWCLLIFIFETKKNWLPENDPRRTHFDFFIILEGPLVLNQVSSKKDILIRLEALE